MDIATGLAAASAALSTVKQLAELDKTLSQSELKLKMAGLYSDLADVRMALSDAKETVADLSGQISRFQAWQDEQGLYSLADAGSGVMVYRYRGDDPLVPPHSLCPQCFAGGKKSILQPEERNPGRNEHLFCNVCKLDLITSGGRVVGPRR